MSHTVTMSGNACEAMPCVSKGSMRLGQTAYCNTSSTRHDDEIDSYVNISASSTNTTSTITPNLKTPGASNDNITSVVKRVYHEKVISVTDYLHLSSYIYWVSCVVITAWFVIAYTISGFSVGNIPVIWNYGIGLPILQGITFSLTALFITVLLVICVWKSEHPLVKTRGSNFILSLTISCVLTLAGAVLCIVPNYVEFKVSAAYTWAIQTSLLLGTVSMISVLVCRQSFLYYLFFGIPRPFKDLCSIWWLTYLLCTLPACIIPVINSTLSLIDSSSAYKMLYLIPYVLPLCLLLFYAYKSRKIGAGFCSWASNLRLAVFLTILNVLLRVLMAYVMPTTAGGLPNQWTVLLKQYVFLYMISITMAETLLTIAILAVLDIRPLQCLDPKNTFRSTIGTTSTRPITKDVIRNHVVIDEEKNTGRREAVLEPGLGSERLDKKSNISMHMDNAVQIDSLENVDNQDTLCECGVAHC